MTPETGDPFLRKSVRLFEATVYTYKYDIDRVVGLESGSI
jgi:hypothetical protein